MPSPTAIPPDASPVSCIVFEGDKVIARGGVAEVAPVVREALARADAPVLVFDAASSEIVEIGPNDPAPPPPPQAAPPATPRGPGRPKLGVVAREVTLLPRHWEWLNGQPGGASVALRKLVEAARREHAGADAVRAAQAAAYRFMSAIAGDLHGFEDAARVLFRGDGPAFAKAVSSWPDDVREHVRVLAAAAFAAPGGD